MSGVPKRLHEEVNHPTTSKNPLEESSLPPLSVKISQLSSNEYHQPFELGPEGRLAKVPRTEARDADKRPILFPAYRLSSSTNDSSVDHPVTTENRSESKDFKESRDSKVENRDSKVEAKDLHTEARVDAQSGKGEKDVRLESRGDDNKEIKHGREPHTDFKAETKIEKDGYTAWNSHSNWKENKEQHKTKRFSETPEDSLEPWRVSRHNMHGPNETRKEASTTEERDHSEAHEAVGENKLDLKSEDKIKEKERKRKDEKQRDWGERDRNERRNNLQVGSTNSEHRESTREEREAERWERERKELLKDKERAKEREKDHIRKETPNGIEKEDTHNGKELMDGSIKMPEQENSVSEQKRQNEFDSWKSVDRDATEKRREKDDDMELDRHEKRSRSYEKESDDGCTEGDGGSERERDGFGYGIQQRKRMLRPRGSPQVANREPRFRSRTRDNEGSQGKPEVSTVVYKAGECMQELIKLWKEFEESQDNKTDENARNGPTLEIRIPAEYVTATNRQVRGGQLWGTDIYTNDSDLVAVLMHTGYCRPTASPPPPAIQELRATIRVLPPQDCYTSTLRNNVRSRAWGAAIGCSYRVERCCIVKKGGGTIDLEPCLTHTSAVEPTLAPVAVERTMTTRSAASNALRQQRFVREVTIQYNLCNEPWIKYSISIVADKGLKKPLYTSARLKKGEVLYLETHKNRYGSSYTNGYVPSSLSLTLMDWWDINPDNVVLINIDRESRYELCFNGEKMVSAMTTSQAPDAMSEKLHLHSWHAQNGERSHDRENMVVDAFRWSRCKKPLTQKAMRSIGIPLSLEHLEVLEENLEWEDVQWSQTGVWIAGKEYLLARVHFLSPK